MRARPDGRRYRRITSRAGAGLVAALVLTGLLGPVSAAAAPGTADAAPATGAVSDAVLTWSVNQEVGSGAFAGGCNFLSAGTAGDSGSSHPWTDAEAGQLYRTRDGAVTVEKPDSSGVYQQPSWATKCLNPYGVAVSPASTDPANATGNRVRITGGTGSFDPNSGTATLAWAGSFTVVFYGGYTYWSASNPVLTVAADGSGRLTATASGYGTDMADPSRWTALPERQITLANLTGVAVTPTGLAVTPEYLGVAVTGTQPPQPAKTPANQAHWGAFPQDFVDYQQLTGQAAYWYSSGGTRDAAKPVAPLSVSYGLPPAPEILTDPKPTTVTVGAPYTMSVTATGDDLHYRWQRAAPGSPTFTDVAGASSSVLTATASSTAVTGTRFRAVVSNASGTVASSPAALTVARAAAKVSVGAASGAVYGTAARIPVTVTGPSGVAVSGTVTVRAGSTVIGTATLAAGKATVSLPKTLTAARRALVVGFGGNANLLPATASTTLTVAKAKPKVGATGPTSVRYGQQVTVIATVGVTGGVTVSGTVTVKSSAGTALGAGRLTKGKASIALPRTMAVGAKRLTVAYSGDANTAAASTTRALTVVKARSSTTAKLSRSVVTTTRASLKVTVTVPGVVPTGTVTIKAGTAGTKTVATVRLTAAHKGSVAVTLPRLGVGTHKVVAIYGGTTTITGSSSASQRLIVR